MLKSNVRFELDGDAIDRLAAAAVPMAGRAAERIADVARQLCPVRTGRLRASISAEQQAAGAKVVAAAPYAAAVEFGTRDAPAQPFLRPALDAAK